MRKIRVYMLSFMGLLFTAVLLGCNTKTIEPDDPDNGNDALKGYKVVALQREITSVQPMTGIVLWPTQAAARDNTLGKSISLEYSYCLPSDVVTGKSGNEIQYNWSSFESILNAISGRGHQAIIRFRYEYPNATTNGVKGGTAVPAYIKELPDYNETFSADPGGDGPTYYADWSNSELMWFTRQFYADFAKKYDQDPRIAFLQIGFGHWSEYHIYGSQLKLGVNFPTHEYQEEFLQFIETQFKVLPWNISIDAADSKYSPIVKTTALMNLNFGLYDDSFMHSKHEISQGGGYNERSWNSIGKDRWMRAPAGGEVSYYTRDDQRNFLDPEGMYGFTWEEAAAKYHITYMIGNDAPGGKHANAQRMKEAALASGYKFQITDFRVKDNNSYVEVKNIGVAPFYRDAYLTVNGVRAENSLKHLLPDSTLSVFIPSGGTNPELSIECDFLLNGQAIEFEADIK